ncbi:prepilin peptidase [Amycolatopsis rhizosphaerae]|uniref:Prepilin peptidase n=2 Tax=Amycolatopsis rhizosphaerae TaxID=2053003 RepID=A0A558B082_9PSEU|nr:A24 family peptidase [Amycolatopsis rhizosphaerae]TVT29920.1 prepilin peptidase [Amycolatopsis rhizosphaerae]
MTWGILPIFAMAGAAAGLFTAFVLTRAAVPAPVPRGPVAAGTALLWLVVAWRWGAGAWPPWWLPVPLAVTTVAVPLVAADLRHRRLPDVLTLPSYPLLGIVLGLAAVLGPGTGLAGRAVAAATVFGGLHLLAHTLARGSLGAGDVKLSGVLGAVLGAVSWTALVVAAVLAAVLTAVLAVSRRWHGGVPHGPGLLAATWLVSVFPAAEGQVGMGT